MKGYQIVSLKELLDQLEESKVKDLLSSFSCPLNKDIEYFLKHKAIEFAKSSIAPTHLIYASYKEMPVLIAYFTITMKHFLVSEKYVTKSTFKRIKKFGNYDTQYKNCCIPAPLIAQLGKNFTFAKGELITGSELLAIACNEVKKSQSIVGGKIVYIECEDIAKLNEFYSSNGFVCFGRRNLDKDEVDRLNGAYLLQMLKYID